MKHPIKNTIIFSSMLVSAAFAGDVAWMKAGDFWVDVNTFHQDGKSAKLVLFNSANKKFGSKTSFVEYNCSNKQMRVLQDTYYTKALAQGKAIRTEEFHSNMTVPDDGTTESKIVGFICGGLMKEIEDQKQKQ